jgi:hypothetical protein
VSWVRRRSRAIHMADLRQRRAPALSTNDLAKPMMLLNSRKTAGFLHTKMSRPNLFLCFLLPVPRIRDAEF